MATNFLVQSDLREPKVGQSENISGFSQSAGQFFYLAHKLSKGIEKGILHIDDDHGYAACVDQGGRSGRLCHP